jgi:GAF domain-containing protein
MKETRLTLLPDGRFSPLLFALHERLTAAGRSITAHNFASMLDATMRRVIHMGFSDAHADEGTVWIADETEDALVAAYNTGPSAQKLVGQCKQPLGAGLISMVFANERPFLENDVFTNSTQSKSVDSLLNLQTHAMIAAPLYFLDGCRGVISCVQLMVAGASDCGRGFDEEDKAGVCHAAATLGQLIDHRVLRSIVGLG